MAATKAQSGACRVGGRTVTGVDAYTLLLTSSRDYDILFAFFNLWYKSDRLTLTHVYLCYFIKGTTKTSTPFHLARAPSPHLSRVHTQVGCEDMPPRRNCRRDNHPCHRALPPARHDDRLSPLLLRTPSHGHHHPQVQPTDQHRCNPRRGG